MIINNPKISSDELGALTEAIADITILIGGADGKIDHKELAWSEKIAKIRSYALPEVLQPFYKEVGKGFHDKVEYLVESLPNDVEERTNILIQKLEALNPILAKLDQNEGAELYNSYVTFARHVAKASGGFLGFWAVSYEESKFMGLPMLTPIQFVEEA